MLSNILTRTQRREVQELRVVRRVVAEIAIMSEPEEEFYKKVTGLETYAETAEINRKFLLSAPQRMMASSMFGALSHWRKSQKNRD